MAKFTGIVLLALCAFQSTLARPRLQDSDPMAQARVIVSQAEQDIFDNPTMSLFIEMDIAVEYVFDNFLVEVIEMTSIIDFPEYYNLDTPEKLEKKAAELRTGLAGYAKYQLEKFIAATTSATADIQKILLAASAEIDEIGEKAQSAKALLTTIEHAYAEFLKSATVTVNNAVKTGLNLTDEAVDRLVTGPDDWRYFDDIETQIVNTERSTEGIISGQLQKADAEVQDAIAAFFQA